MAKRLDESDVKFARILVLLVLAEAVAALSASTFYGAIGDMVVTFGGVTTIGWMLTAFYLAKATFGPIGARMGDAKGRKYFLLLALVLVAAGSVVVGLSTTSRSAILGRALQGGAGAILPLCMGILRENFQASQVRLGAGILVGTATLCGGAGVLLGGVVGDLLGWREIFFAMAAISVLAALLVFAVVANTSSDPRPGATVDAMGGVLFVAAILCLLCAFDRPGLAGPSIWSMPILLLSSFAIFALWVWHELRHPCPLIDVSLFANRQIMIASVSTMCLALGSYQFGLVLMRLLQQPSASGAGLGLSGTMAGLFMFFPLALSFFASPLGAVLASGRSALRPLIASGFVLAICWSASLFAQQSLVGMFLLLCAISPAIVVMATSLNMILMEAAPTTRTSEVVGLNGTIRAASQAVGAFVVATVLDAFSTAGPYGHGMPTTNGYATVFALMAVVSLAAVMFAVRAAKRPIPVA